MRVLRHSDPDFVAQLRRIAGASSLFDEQVEQRTRAILEAVRDRGDQALLELTERFDGARLRTAQLRVSEAERRHAARQAGADLRRAVELAERNIAAFSRRALRRRWSTRNSQGARVGEKFDPFGRVGIYIPGGTAPLVSTALMTITLARVAGCREIVVCTPCGPEGRISPGLLYAADRAGATEIYRVGGAQAVAAMAFGTSTLARVQKVFGPGNAYVVAAKRLLVGQVSIDLLPGPSEVLILADETADPRFVATDLLAQAEHGSGHERVWLVTTSHRLLRAVDAEIAGQLPSLSRKHFITSALSRNGWLILVRNMTEGLDLVNQIAPEHCELMLRYPARAIRAITTAGAIFVGPHSPTVTGDYVAGPSHTLPTGGAGLSFAGLTVDQFQRRTSVVEYREASLRRSLPAIRTFAAVEGLDAHLRSATVRFDGEGRASRARRTAGPGSIEKSRGMR